MILNLNIDGGNMLVQCKETFRQQIKEGSIYLVIEILIKRNNNSVSYRVVDSEGYPAIYDAEKFVIISNCINKFALSLTSDCIILSPKQILDSELNEKNIEGFWGLFIEDNLEAREILKVVVSELALDENVLPPLLL